MKTKKGYSSIIACIVLIFAVALSGSFGLLMPKENAVQTAYAYEIPTVEGDWLTELENYLPKNPNGSYSPDAGKYLSSKPYNATRTGAEDNPYLIMDALDLTFLSWASQHTYNTFDSNETYYYYALGADIDLEGKEWIPIGYYSNTSASYNNRRFHGAIDGTKEVDGVIVGNYKIKNMSILDSNDNYRGLIAHSMGHNKFTNIDFENPYVSGIGTHYAVLVGFSVGDLTIDNVNINNGYVYSANQSTAYVGALSGLVQTNGEAITISNVTTNTDVETNGNYVGGLFGNIDENGNASTADPDLVNENITITNAVNYGTITGSQFVGGLVGRSEYIQIANSSNRGYIYSSPVISTGNDAGGLVGRIQCGVKITSSYNEGVIEGYQVGGLVGAIRTIKIDSEITDCYNISMLNGQNIGGAVGYYVAGHADNLITINNFYNIGEMVSLGHVGGIVAYVDGSITINNSHNDSDIISESNAGNAGGLIGNKETVGTVIINNSHNTGDIITPLKNYVGGLVGYAMNNTLGGIEVHDSYNIGTLEGKSVGGLVGYARGYIDIDQSFNMGSVMANTDYSGGLIGYALVENGSAFNNFGISNSYNTGEISAGVRYNGGLIGYIRFYGTTAGTPEKTFIISHSFNAAIVQKGSVTNGLIGVIDFHNTPNLVQRIDITDSFSLNNASEDEVENILNLLPVNAAGNAYTVSGGAVSNGLREIVVNGIVNQPFIEEEIEEEVVTTFTIADFVLSLDELRDVNTYANYDFDNIWAMPEGTEGNNGAPYLKDIAGLNLTLVIDSETTVNYNAVVLEHVDKVHEIEGKTFVGWATHEDSSHPNYFLYEKGTAIPLENIDITLYAKYETTKYYHIVVDDFTEGSLQAKLTTGDNPDNAIGFALKEDDNSYIIEVVGDAEQLATFTGWQVYKESEGAWHTIASHYEKTLNLKNRIDQEFINEYSSLYVDPEINGVYSIYGALRFRAGKATETVEIYAISASSNYGKLRINNFDASFDEDTFTTAPYEGTTVTLKAIPNEFYTVHKFEIIYYYGAGETGSQDLTPNSEYQSTFVLSVPNQKLTKVEVKLEFVKIEYDVEIVARTTEDAEIIVENLLAISSGNSKYLRYDDQASITITANSDHLIRDGERLRFVGFKIMNYISNSYDYILGETPNQYLLNEVIGAEFINNYTDNENKLVIIAEYTTEYEVKITSGEGGELEIVISSPTQPLPIIANEIDAWFEKGATINITATADTHYLFSEYEGKHNGLITGNKLDITLTDNVDIVSNFTLQLYNIVVQFRNYNTDDLLNDIGEVQLSLTTVKVGDTLEFSNTLSPEGYRFESFQIRGLGNQLNDIDNSVLIDDNFLLQYKNNNNEIVLAARYVQQFTINIEVATNQASMGAYELRVNTSDDPENEEYVVTDERTFDIGTRIQIEATANDFHNFLGFVNVSLSEKVAGEDLVNIRLINNRTVNLRFEPIVYEVNSEESVASSGTLTLNKDKFSVGDEVVIMFTPESGQVIKDWTINGINVNQLENAKVTSNSVTLTITSDWLKVHNNNLVSKINTQLNPTILIAIIGVGSVVIILTAAFIYLFISNAKKKAIIRQELKDKEMAKYRMNTSSFIQDLREGKDVGQVTDEQVKAEMKRRKKEKKK